jgi:hypothetical protein
MSLFGDQKYRLLIMNMKLITCQQGSARQNCKDHVDDGDFGGQPAWKPFDRSKPNSTWMIMSAKSLDAPKTTALARGSSPQFGELQAAPCSLFFFILAYFYFHELDLSLNVPTDCDAWCTRDMPFRVSLMEKLFRGQDIPQNPKQSASIWKFEWKQKNLNSFGTTRDDAKF